MEPNDQLLLKKAQELANITLTSLNKICGELFPYSGPALIQAGATIAAAVELSTKDAIIHCSDLTAEEAKAEFEKAKQHVLERMTIPGLQ